MAWSMVNLSTVIGPSAVGRSTRPWNTRLVMVTLEPVNREGLALTSGCPAPTARRLAGGTGEADTHGRVDVRGAGFPLGLAELFDDGAGSGAAGEVLGCGLAAGDSLGAGDGSSSRTMPPTMLPSSPPLCAAGAEDGLATVLGGICGAAVGLRTGTELAAAVALPAGLTAALVFVDVTVRHGAAYADSEPFTAPIPATTSSSGTTMASIRPLPPGSRAGVASSSNISSRAAWRGVWSSSGSVSSSSLCGA